MEKKITLEVKVNLKTLERFGKYVDYVRIPELSDDTIRLVVSNEKPQSINREVCNLSSNLL